MGYVFLGYSRYTLVEVGMQRIACPSASVFCYSVPSCRDEGDYPGTTDVNYPECPDASSAAQTPSVFPANDGPHPVSGSNKPNIVTYAVLECGTRVYYRLILVHVFFLCVY